MMLKGILLFVLVQFLAPALSFTNICPPVEDLEPCSCASDRKTMQVECMGVTSAEDVRKALSSTKGIKRVFVDLIRAHMDKVPSDLFKGLDITRVSFIHCKFKSIGDEGMSALKGLENTIEELSVHYSVSEPDELKFLNVSGLNVLRDLDIEGNAMKKLGNEWFRDGPTSVKNLYIMTNFIEELGDKAFESLVNLKSLWLTKNRFKVVKRSMLPSPAKYLVSLDLTNNEISSLPDDMFTNMPSIEEVILAENSITRLPQSTWSPVWRWLTSLDIEKNPLECDSHIEWMFKVARPYVVRGKCVSPDDRKDKDLKRIIDDKRLMMMMMIKDE